MFKITFFPQSTFVCTTGSFHMRWGWHNPMGRLKEIFGDTPQVRLLEVLIAQKDTTLHLSMLARRAKVSVSSVERCLLPLIKAGIVSDIRFFQRRRILHLNPKNPIAKLLVNFVQDVENDWVSR